MCSNPCVSRVYTHIYIYVYTLSILTSLLIFNVFIVFKINDYTIMNIAFVLDII